MSETRFRKGDRVRLQIGTRPVEGVVKEDRGPIGIKGRRLFLVEFRGEAMASSPREIELPAERLQLVGETASTD